MSASSKRLAIFGGLGAAVLLAETARRASVNRSPVEVIGLLNDLEGVGKEIHGYRVIGRFESWIDLDDEVRLAAPLHRVGDMRRRLERIRRLGVPEKRWLNVIDPSAVLHAGSRVDTGVFVSAFAVIQSGVHLGPHTAVRDHATVGHDSIIGDFVHIGQNAVICGYCDVRRGAYIAPGALIREGTTVGEFATIGLGAVVTCDVPAGAKVTGPSVL